MHTYSILLVMCLLCSELSAAVLQEPFVLHQSLLPVLLDPQRERLLVDMPRNTGLQAATLALPLLSALAAPSGFPETGNGLWYKTPGSIWTREYLPVGNGFLAGMIYLHCYSFRIYPLRSVEL